MCNNLQLLLHDFSVIFRASLGWHAGQALQARKGSGPRDYVPARCCYDNIMAAVDLAKS